MDPPPVQYVKTSDGYDIAYTVCGEGQPLVLLPPAISHVQLEWSTESPMYEWMQHLGSHFQLVRYDGRGQGMSSRGLNAGYSAATIRSDLEAVLGRLQLSRAVLMASHASAHAAIDFAVDRPQKVEALILHALSAKGDAWPVINAVNVAETNWEFFLSSMFYSSTPFGQKPLERRNSYLRQCVEQADWVHMARAWMASDVTDRLALLTIPTLILHPRNYVNVALQEAKGLAAKISGSQLVLVEGSWSFGDAAFGVRAIENFLADLPSLQDRLASMPDQLPANLSQRELEVLRLLAHGRSNPQIAEELFISRSTVQNHVSNILIKLDLQNRAQAAVYAKEHGLV